MPQDDKSLSWDALIHLKYLNSAYHMATTEAATEGLKKDLMDMYRDEQNNLYKLFNVMQSRGWYTSPQPADSNQIDQARQQIESEGQKVFSGMRAQPGAGPQPGIGTQPGVQPHIAGQPGQRGPQFGGPRPQV
ncbi:MAG: spore coat protein [Bacillota bacterium]